MGQGYSWISALLWRLCLALNTGLRVVLDPLVRWNVLGAILAVSLFTAVVMALVWRATARQEAIKRIKDKIRAHLLEILLFNDDLRMVFRAQGCVLMYSARYLANSVPPLLVLIIPVGLIVAQSDHFFASEPLRAGGSLAVSVTLDTWNPELVNTVSLSVPNGLAVETPPLRIPQRKEIVWRIRAPKRGDFNIVVHIGDESITKRLTVADNHRCVSHARVKPTILGAIMHSAEAPLPGSSVARSIELGYARCSVKIGMFGWHWLVPFFVFSTAFALLLKTVAKV